MPPSMQNSMLMMSSSTLPSPSPPPFPLERKLKKPLMEKRRRARMNECLDQLKRLLMNVTPNQRSKLEKADILEMTVAFLKQQNGHRDFESSESAMRHRQKQAFSEGFSMAAVACIEFIQNSVADNGALGAAITQHLQSVIAAQMENARDNPSSQPSPHYQWISSNVSPKPGCSPNSPCAPCTTTSTPSLPFTCPVQSYLYTPQWNQPGSRESSIRASISPPGTSPLNTNVLHQTSLACPSESESTPRSQRHLPLPAKTLDAKVWRPF